MKSVREAAFAKLNLTLDVGVLRPDAYHEMDMVMQSVSLCDTLTLTVQASPGLTLRSTRADLPTDDGNLAIRAARYFLDFVGQRDLGLLITLEKRIPVCAGLAGGSSDAAAVLRACNRLLGTSLPRDALLALAGQIGSDVPYCLLGGTARAQGRGERLTPLPALPPCHIVLCKPDFDVSTPVLFRRLDESGDLCHPDTAGILAALAAGDLASIAQRLGNVFTFVLPPQEQEAVHSICKALVEAGALGAGMSGTGPTVFGLFAQRAVAEQAVAQLQTQYREVFLTQVV